MGLWCGTRTSRGASAWTHRHDMWDTSVFSTATAPCTETHIKTGYCICCFHPGWMFMISAGIDFPHWCQELISNSKYMQDSLNTDPNPEPWGHCCHMFYSIVNSLYCWRSAVIKESKQVIKQVKSKDTFKLENLFLWLFIDFFLCLLQHKIQTLKLEHINTHQSGLN